MPRVFLTCSDLPHHSHYIVPHSVEVSWVRAYWNSIKFLQSINYFRCQFTLQALNLILNCIKGFQAVTISNRNLMMNVTKYFAF